MSYSSSLTDQEWEVLEPLLSQILPKRSRLDHSTGQSGKSWMAFSTNSNGCNLQDLPCTPTSLFDCLLALQAVNWATNDWVTWTSAWTGEKKAKWTRLIIIDSQAFKNTCNASVTSKGYCFYKSTNRIKRHLAVDTLGFPFFTHCTKANVSDDRGLLEMLALLNKVWIRQTVELNEISSSKVAIVQSISASLLTWNNTTFCNVIWLNNVVTACFQPSIRVM